MAEAIPAPGTWAGQRTWLAGLLALGTSSLSLLFAKLFAAKSPSSWHPGLLNWSQLAVLPPTTLVIIRWQHSESGWKAAEHYILAEERELSIGTQGKGRGKEVREIEGGRETKLGLANTCSRDPSHPGCWGSGP